MKDTAKLTHGIVEIEPGTLAGIVEIEPGTVHAS